MQESVQDRPLRISTADFLSSTDENGQELVFLRRNIERSGYVTMNSEYVFDIPAGFIDKIVPLDFLEEI